MLASSDYQADRVILQIAEDPEEAAFLAATPDFRGVYKYSNAFRFLRPGQSMPTSRTIVRAPVVPPAAFVDDGRDEATT